MSSEGKDVLAVLDEMVGVCGDEFGNAVGLRIKETLDIIAELIAADVEYDEALAVLNNTVATHPYWVQFHARFESARTRRAAALKAAQGGE